MAPRSKTEQQKKPRSKTMASILIEPTHAMTLSEGAVQAAVKSAQRQPDISEEYLTRKFARADRTEGKIEYEVTRDPGLLQQYYRLRDQMFINVWGLERFSGQKDAYDDKSDIVVARIGNLVVGGMRVTYNVPGTDRLLPMEGPDFRLHSMLPECNVDEVNCAEVSRFVILPEYQNSAVMLEMIRRIFRRGVEKKVQFAFSISPLVLARNYRKAGTLFGVSWSVRNDVVVPEREEFEGIKMVFSMVDLRSIYTNEAAGKRLQQDVALTA
jgi:hypothetical protein